MPMDGACLRRYRLRRNASKAFRMYDKVLKQYSDEANKNDLLKAMLYARMARQYGKSVEYAELYIKNYGHHRLVNDIIEMDTLLEVMSDRKTGNFSAIPTTLADEHIDIAPAFTSDGELAFASVDVKHSPKR